MSTSSHKHTVTGAQNQKASLANAYNELGKELSSTKIKVVGNYTLGKVIGEGAFGKVRMGTHRLTSTRVAIKQIPKGMSASLTREIHHHRQLHHPNITQMYEVIATESSIWIITELCSGGELFDYLAEKGRLEEEETRILMGQLCLAVAYLHDKGIVHRDLKLENVLLDERCRIKLGDFGFTREFERGSFLETFCGTTGYASPEMLQGMKYQGPEVDVWSLGIILYCLLTGTLPFDDDDEGAMRQKIIVGDFEDPEWLSDEARELIQNILQSDPTKRPTISQILAHPWFLPPPPLERPASSRPVSMDFTNSQTVEFTAPFKEATDMSATSDATFLTAHSDVGPSLPPTPIGTDDSDPFFSQLQEQVMIHKASQNKKTLVEPPLLAEGTVPSTPDRKSFMSYDVTDDEATPHRRPRSRGGAKPPPAYSVRTPARTKRRSVSSNLSDPASPTTEKLDFTPLPQQDFSSLLTTPAPIIFSTPLERNLLNTLSTLGLDTGQIVHSVLSDACDAAGALWWMLKRKAEKKAFEEATMISLTEEPISYEIPPPSAGVTKRTRGVQTETVVTLHPLSLARSAPQLAVLPASPLQTSPSTPPLPSGRPSGSSANTLSSSKSYPASPSNTIRDKDGSTKARPSGKNRSGSVSIMQRATTALEAAGLVRKKSGDALREAGQERERSRDATDRKYPSYDESRHSGGSASASGSKLTKSPIITGKDPATPRTPPFAELQHPQPQMGSPWVLAGPATISNSKSSPTKTAPTPANSPGELSPLATYPSNLTKVQGPRNRASILSAFRLWFVDDRKGKGKEKTRNPGSRPATQSRATPSPGLPPSQGGTMKRRTSGSGKGRNSHRPRPSVSSRRSSSVNSRRSSGTSAQVLLLDSIHDQIPTRKSFGSHTPNSERGEHSSRPSSIRSFSMQQRHRKSPSASSAGSARFRTGSPLQKYHSHKRGSSGSSTRVVRQTHPTQRHHHGRTNSGASSTHSPASSRPTSFYDYSENEAAGPTTPFKGKGGESKRGGGTTFVAQKRQTPFAGYSYSIGRTSWKKSWGMEPPGWQSRSSQVVPVEVLAVSPGPDGAQALRDVFSGRQSLSLGDESDWVDEDDDIPTYHGGFGQLGMLPPNNSKFKRAEPLNLSPVPRGGRSSKRMSKKASPKNSSSSVNRQKAGHSPAERSTPLPSEGTYTSSDARGGRRQLPPGRTGNAFKQPIEEVDEGEEC